jgi:hypothetical protein
LNQGKAGLGDKEKNAGVGNFAETQFMRNKHSVQKGLEIFKKKLKNKNSTKNTFLHLSQP